MSRKSKGLDGERELIHKFWDAGWAAIRVAGSGSIRYPCPDILAGNNLKKYAIECKVTSEGAKYFSGKEIEELLSFAARFGAESWVAVKFGPQGWRFFTVDDLEETPRGYVARKGSPRGLLFEEIVK